MIFPLFRRNRRPGNISALYGMIVAQARLPCFYQDYAVADTVNGRFDLIVLHLTLVLDRLNQEPALREQGQELFDLFCQDMDHNLREMGISDLKVPKEMRRMGEAFYGRAQAYRAALAEPGDQALAETVARNIYGGVPPAPAAPARLAAYVRHAVSVLATQEPAAIANSTLRWPDPIALALAS
jgi:cytochrome b pre-mRNA-processing protein 3